MNSMMRFFASSYGRVTVWLKYLENPLLLFIRVYWGWQFAQSGWEAHAPGPRGGVF